MRISNSPEDLFVLDSERNDSLNAFSIERNVISSSIIYHGLIQCERVLQLVKEKGGERIWNVHRYFLWLEDDGLSSTLASRVINGGVDFACVSKCPSG